MNKLHSSGTDNWLTPPELVKALGPFDFDPCCPEEMPWQTAARMVCLPEDGLVAAWEGRVWCNPPYSDVLPWARKMVLHGEGTMLVSTKSTDTIWAQHLFDHCDAVFFLKGRLLFHYVDGSPSKGKWLANMLVAFSEADAKALERLPALGFHGTLFKPVRPGR